MVRLVALAAISALTVPAALLLLSSNNAPRIAAERHGADPVPVVTIAQVVPPNDLREAMTRVAAVADAPFEGEERCLAQAVYFEARSEPLEGQLAVAQVVLNRVESAYWPDSICEVVFENDHRRHKCQFSFACDGLPDEPKNPRSWDTAKMISAVALHRMWGDVTETATHYHADYVAPYWKHVLDPTVQHGRHLFYREARARVGAVSQQQGGS